MTTRLYNKSIDFHEVMGSLWYLTGYPSYIGTIVL